MSYLPTIVWGGSQLAAVLLSRDILEKIVTFSGSLLYRRLSHEPAHVDQAELQADLARVTTLLHEALGHPEGHDDSWEELNEWEIARCQPGSVHRHSHLFRRAHPRDMAAWQLKETVEAVMQSFEPGHRATSPERLRDLIATMHARAEALLAVWHTAEAEGSNFCRHRSQSMG